MCEWFKKSRMPDIVSREQATQSTVIWGRAGSPDLTITICDAGFHNREIKRIGRAELFLFKTLNWPRFHDLLLRRMMLRLTLHQEPISHMTLRKRGCCALFVLLFSLAMIAQSHPPKH